MINYSDNLHIEVLFADTLKIGASLVTMPLGFITTNKKSVKIIGALITEYLKSSSGFDKPHDCGFISSIVEKC
ncbi:hypothetical protein DN619_24820 [Klebsiella michiganensis]|nr:hypothetical protein CIG58_11035 [Klebsiella oxytoca]RWT39413.1 hypothetical protein DN619_24820 [Klebsiella michiganensis]